MPPSPSPTPLVVEIIGGQAASFWNSPFFVALLALLGVGVGAALTHLSSWAQESRKIKRDNLRKWDDRVLAHASRAISLAKQVTEEANTDPADMPVTPTVHTDENGVFHITMPPAWGIYRELEEECVALQVIATRAVNDASRALLDATKSFFFASDSRAQVESSSEIEYASDDLRDAIRASLGLADK